MKTLFFILLLFTSFSGFLLSQEYTKITDIPYTEEQTSEKQKLDIYIPQSFDGIMPCLVWIHGGAWQYGSKDGLAPEIDTILHHGYIVVSIGYRLSSEDIFPAQIYDCKTAIRYLKENSIEYNIDTSRIAVAGASAGGHLAALLGTSSNIPELEDKSQGSESASSRVHAVIDFYGPTDFLIMDMLPDVPPDSCGDSMKHLVSDSPESLLLGCNITECPDKVKLANPMTYISKEDPPFLIFHGTFDCVVTPKSSIEFKKQIKEKGIPVNLHLLPHAGHGGPEFVTDEVKSIILDFLNSVFNN